MKVVAINCCQFAIYFGLAHFCPVFFAGFITYVGWIWLVIGLVVIGGLISTRLR
jgi:hypothetical protein